MNKIRVSDAANFLIFLKQKNISFLRMMLKGLRKEDSLATEAKSRQELLQLIRQSIEKNKKTDQGIVLTNELRSQITSQNNKDLNRILKFQEKNLEDFVKSSCKRQRKMFQKQNKYERTIIQLGSAQDKKPYNQDIKKQIEIGLQKVEAYKEGTQREDDKKIKKYLIERKKKKVSFYVIDDLQNAYKKQEELLKNNLLELGIQSELIFPLRLIETKWQNSQSVSVKVLQKSDIKTTNIYLKDSLPYGLKAGIFTLPYKKLSQILAVMNTIKYWHYCSKKHNISEMIQEVIKLEGRQKQIVELWQQLEKYTQFCLNESSKFSPTQLNDYAEKVLKIVYFKFSDKESQNYNLEISSKYIYIGFKLFLTNLISKHSYGQIPQLEKQEFKKQIQILILKYINCFFTINQSKSYSYISQIENMLKSLNIIFTLIADLKKQYEINITDVLKTQEYFAIVKDLFYGMQTIFQLDEDTKTIASPSMANSFIQNLTLFVERQQQYFTDKISFYCFSLAHSHLRALSPKGIRSLIRLLKDSQIIEKYKKVHDTVLDILKLGIGLDGKQTVIALKILFKLRIQKMEKQAVAQKLIEANISGQEGRDIIQILKSIIQGSFQNEQKKGYILQYLTECQTPLPQFSQQ